jgi:PAS domain S-box-containing protein
MSPGTASTAPAGEAGFRLLAEHLPDLIILAFHPDLTVWAATGGGLRARGWTPDQFLGRKLPEVGRPDDAEITEVYCRAALRGQCRRLETIGNKDPSRLWAFQFVPLPDEGDAVIGGMLIARDVTEQRRAEAERRRLLGRVYEVQEGQDRRLAADLHDGHVQSLAAIGFKLEQARLRLGATGSPEADELLWQVTKDLATEVTSLRRTIGRLRPLVLVEEGLEAALREEAKCACNRAALAACEVVSELDGRLDPVVETALFRVAQQALANVVDHAAATHAQVAIECAGGAVTLRVSDDGCGFDPDHVQVLGDVANFGLIAMRERVEALGGRFQVTTAPNQGTVVEARVPLIDPVDAWEP